MNDSGTYMMIAAVYLAAVNLTGLSVMGIDKHRAAAHRMRIPENLIFIISIIGGSAGVWAGMYLFRHKTRRRYFTIGIPLILALQILAAVLAVSIMQPGV